MKLSHLTLDKGGQFVSMNTDGEATELGVVAARKRGRWQYRDIATGALYASGMEPARFAERFWFRRDYTAPTH